MNLHVLLVDDDAALADALGRQLRDSPYRLSAARSGDEALTAMAQWPADLVVSDEQMPGMTGIDLLAQIAERWPATATMMMTGHATAGTLVHAINRGRIVRCLLKPCQASEVDAAIRLALAWKLARDRGDALLPLYRRQRELLAAVERVSPGLIASLEPELDADPTPGALTRRSRS